MIYGTAYDETLGDELRVTVIATGLSSARRAHTPISVVHTAPLQRNGTDNLPVMTQAVGGATGAAPAHDYSNLSTPSVWRTSRTASSRVDALVNNGMDEIEIPAFLRRQAD